jgi:large subunit ribosomal protein L24
MKTVKKGTVRSKVKRGDQVVFIAGREYSRSPFRGKVIAVDPHKGKVKVEGAMIMKRHRKAIPQMNVEGGIIEQEAWVDISNIAHIDPETGKPTRIRYDLIDGKKVRVARSGKVIPEPERKRRTDPESNTETKTNKEG